MFFFSEVLHLVHYNTQKLNNENYHCSRSDLVLCFESLKKMSNNSPYPLKRLKCHLKWGKIPIYFFITMQRKKVYEK